MTPHTTKARPVGTRRPEETALSIRSHLMTAAALCASVFAAGSAFAQAEAYPSRTIQIVVPFPAGGLNDAVARQVQPELEKALGQNILIDNRVGAAGVVGTTAVVRAAPDGHTLLMVASTHTVTPAINTKLPYDTARDLAPIITVIRDPLIFVSNPKVPGDDLAGFVAYAKSKPGELNYSTPGFGSQSQFVTELFASRAGFKITHVPFRGGAPAIQATVQGDTQFSVISAQLSLPQIESGRLKAIGVGGEQRHPRLPNVLTLKEAGFGDVPALQWVGLFAPARTPPAIIAKLNEAMNKAIADPAFLARLKLQGMSPAGGTPAELQAIVETEIPLWKGVAASAGMKLSE